MVFTQFTCLFMQKDIHLYTIRNPIQNVANMNGNIGMLLAMFTVCLCLYLFSCMRLDWLDTIVGGHAKGVSPRRRDVCYLVGWFAGMFGICAMLEKVSESPSGMCVERLFTVGVSLHSAGMMSFSIPVIHFILLDTFRIVGHSAAKCNAIRCTNIHLLIPSVLIIKQFTIQTHQQRMSDNDSCDRTWHDCHPPGIKHPPRNCMYYNSNGRNARQNIAAVNCKHISVARHSFN